MLNSLHTCKSASLISSERVQYPVAAKAAPTLAAGTDQMLPHLDKLLLTLVQRPAIQEALRMHSSARKVFYTSCRAVWVNMEEASD